MHGRQCPHSNCSLPCLHACRCPTTHMDQATEPKHTITMNPSRLTMRCSDLRALPFSYEVSAVVQPARPAPPPRAAMLTAPAPSPESLSLRSLRRYAHS